MMRRLLILLLALWPAAAWAQFPIVGTLWPCSLAGVVTASHVQGTTASSIPISSTNTYTLSFTSTVVTGHGVMGVIKYGNSSTLASITDDAGNSYALVNTINDNPGNFAVINFYNTSVTGTPKTLSFTFGAGQLFYNLRVAMDEYSNVSAFDTSTAQELTNPGTGTNALTSGNITTATNQELIYATTTSTPSNPGETITAGSGFTLQQFGDGQGDITGASDSQVQSAAGAISGTFTTNQGTAAYVIGVMAFKPTAAQSSCNAPPPPTATFIVAPNGNDAWSGLLAAPNAGATDGPFLTPERCQSAIRGSPTTKTCSFRAGTYPRTVTFSLTPSDTATTWQFYAPDGYLSAIFDGGSTVADGIIITGNNITINGLKVQNFTHSGIQVQGTVATPIIGNVLKNNEVANLPNPPPTENIAAGPFGINVSDAKNTQVLNNYVHNVGGACIVSFAFDAGSTIDGTIISGNVFLSCSIATSDGGAVYINMHATNISGGNVTITNNYIRDYGHSSAGQGGTNYGTVMCIYLDDTASNVKVTGNVCGPPSVQFPSGTDPVTGFPAANNSAVMLQNNDGVAGNGFDTFTGNIVDTGATSAQGVAYLFGQNISFQNNIVLFKFTGSLHTASSANSGMAYMTGTAPTISNNGYVQYAPGGSVFSNGVPTGDTSPVTFTPAQLGSCPNGDYTAFAAAAQALGGAVAFPGITGGFGPPGFVIPVSANHSC